jgi:GTP-binding protein HflX
VINKADIADQDVVNQILRSEPTAVVVSAVTGEGFDELALAIEAALPQWMLEVDVVVPYSRGDLISRVHELGDVIAIDHNEMGSHLVARVPKHLAFELQQASV